MEKTGRVNRRYDADFKHRVILDMRGSGLSHKETIRKYWPGKPEKNHLRQLNTWERIYLEEGADGLMKERRGRKEKPPLPSDVEADLIAENQRLRMENDYLKKLQALVLADAQAKPKKHK